MIEAIHQTTLGTALRCGEQFRRRWGLGEIIPPGVAAARGTGVHKANEVNLKQKIQSNQDLPLSDLEDATRDGYMEALKDGVYIAPDQVNEKRRLVNEGLEDGLRCIRIYQERVAPTIFPLEVEKPFHIEVGFDLPLAGRMDYRKDGTIGDLKTTSKTWPKGREKEEIQPIFYSFVHEKEQGTKPIFHYDILIARRGKDGRPTSQELQDPAPVVIATDKDYAALFHKIEAFLAMLKAGIFPPANPTSWWCSPYYCGYYMTCKYVGNVPAKRWI